MAMSIVLACFHWVVLCFIGFAIVLDCVGDCVGSVFHCLVWFLPLICLWCYLVFIVLPCFHCFFYCFGLSWVCLLCWLVCFMLLSMLLLVSSLFCLWWWLGFHGFVYELGFFFHVFVYDVGLAFFLLTDVVLGLPCF